MTDTPDDKPLEGEVSQPGQKSGKGGTSGGGKRAFNGQQTPEQRAAENKNSETMRAIAIYGLDWKFPGWEPNEQEKRVVIMLKFAGYTDEDVARYMSMSVESLLKYFPDELALGKMGVIGDLTNRAVFRAKEGNDVLTMFLLKTRGGGNFSERAVQMQALGDALDKTEPDEKRRVELVGKILDLLDSSKKTKTKTEKPTTKKEVDAS